jgi:AraC-like DNA-binding protein
MEFLNILYHQYLFFGQFFMVVLAVSQFISRHKLRINYIYLFSYLFMGLGIFQVLSYSTKAFPGYYYISYYLIPVSLGSSLLLYYRYRLIIEDSIRLKPAVFVSVLLSVFIFLAAGPFIINAEFKREFIELRPILDPSFSSLPLFFRIVHLINFIPKLILSGGIFLLLIKNTDIWRSSGDPKIGIARLGYSYAASMIFTTLLLGAGDLFTFQLSKAAIFIVNTSTIGIFFTAQFDPDYYGVFTLLRKKAKYRVSKVKGMDVESVVVKLNRLMEEEHLYRDEDISLKDVADIMDINLQQLSEILNREINKNFNTFINDYRVEEAKKLLADDETLPITHIALSVGFNSTTTFNRSFSRSTGVTPKEFRKMKAAKKSKNR